MRNRDWMPDWNFKNQKIRKKFLWKCFDPQNRF